MGQDVKRVRERAEVLRGGRRGPALEEDRGHRALDNAGIGARGAVREDAGGAVVQEAVVAPVMLGGGNEVDSIKGDADQFNGVDEAQARGGEISGGGSCGHEGAHGVVGAERR